MHAFVLVFICSCPSSPPLLPGSGSVSTHDAFCGSELSSLELPGQEVAHDGVQAQVCFNLGDPAPRLHLAVPLCPLQPHLSRVSNLDFGPRTLSCTTQGLTSGVKCVLALLAAWSVPWAFVLIMFWEGGSTALFSCKNRCLEA